MSVIKLKDKNGNDFWLFPRKAEDSDFRASKEDITTAVNKVVKGTVFYEYFRIRSYSKNKGYTRSPLISTSFTGKTLRLGCHVFNMVNTKKILKWAGVK